MSSRAARRTVTAVATVAALAVTGVGVGTASAGATSTAATAVVADVKVASFNLSSAAFDAQASGEHRTWRVRRPVVVAEVMRNRPDVLGVQEANQSSIYTSSVTYGVNQYMDLRGALAAKGGHYALTNTNAYNCVNPASSSNCVYKYRGASQDTRILYNTDTVTLVKQGSVKFTHQTAGKNPRYLAWAVLRMKATGKQLFFTSTHLDPYTVSVRKAEWDEVIANTKRLAGTLPVVSVGDYNTSKFSSYAATYLPRMKAAGYGDVLGQTYATPLSHPRAVVVDRAWVDSFNRYRRDARLYSYEDARSKIGNSIDWIFATNSLPVKKWVTDAPVDLTTVQLVGVIPSDHFFIQATLTL
ncbi:MAG: endonuclease/exonuclease/phosphatase family protein [Ornithinibacter sp.]